MYCDRLLFNKLWVSSPVPGYAHHMCVADSAGCSSGSCLESKLFGLPNPNLECHTCCLVHLFYSVLKNNNKQGTIVQ